MTCGNTFKPELASRSRDHVVGILRDDNICAHPLVHVAANRYSVRARQRYFLGGRAGWDGLVRLPVSVANNMDVVQAKVGVPQLELSPLHHEDMRDKRTFFLIDHWAREIKRLAAGDVIDPHHCFGDSSLFDPNGINFFRSSTDGCITGYCESLRKHWLPAVQDPARNRSSVGFPYCPDRIPRGRTLS